MHLVLEVWFLSLNFDDKESGLGDFESVLPSQGLSTDQVRRLTESGFSNVLKNDSYKTVWQIIFDNVFTFFNLVFCILSLFLLIAHSYKDMLFMFVIVLNTSIGIFQQIRSKIKLDKLNLISSLKTEVIRNGFHQAIANHEIVKGDIVSLKTGDQITVDAVVLKGSLQADESLLTGETDPILKQEGSILLSGSFVLSGNCLARVKNVGKNCYANKLTLEAKKNSRSAESEMTRSLNCLIQIIGVLLIPIGFLMFVKEILVLHHSYGKAIQAVAASIVGMIPEGLYLLTSVALAISVMKLIKSKTLVHEMSCIEMLARVDVLCVDKTGTITQPKMEVVGVVFLENVRANEKHLTEILSEVVFNMPADSETAAALKRHFKTHLGFVVKRIHPFLSSTKWFAVEFEKEGTFLLGAADFILCEKYYMISSRVEEFAVEGKRVLLFAELSGGRVLDGEIEGEVEPICLVLIENPIRFSAEKTFRFFEQKGVEIKVISGDNPVAVSSICRKIHLKNAENFVDASKLKTEEEIEEALNSKTVFGRVSPSQKRQFVKILQKKGKHTVAMTGDGVNDVLALRQADVGVAMASGSSAASQAAAIVLLNSNFASMPKIVHEGQRVINNIERSAALFLVKNIFSFCFAVLTIFFKIGFPITPFQSSCISFLTIGTPSFLLTLENTAGIIKGKFLNNVFKKALPGGFCNVLVVLFVQVLTQKIGFSDDETSAFCVVVIAFNGLPILFELCRPMNWKRNLVFSITAGLMIISFGFLVFSSRFSYFNFFSNYFVIFLISMFFLIDYFVLRVLTILFSFKIFRRLFRLIKLGVKNFLKFLRQGNVN